MFAITPVIQIDELLTNDMTDLKHSKTVAAKINNRRSTMLPEVADDFGSDDDRMDYMMAHLESHQSNYISKSLAKQL